MAPAPLKHILVLLPSAPARVIAALLNESGYLASVACSIPELHPALQSADPCLVVTIGPDFDIVRDLTPLPVIDIELFLKAPLSAEAAQPAGAQFDVPAFLRRLEAVTEERQANGETVASTRSAPEKDPGPWRRRWLRQPEQSLRTDVPKPLLINSHTALG
jgi:hypothetical protein